MHPPMGTRCLRTLKVFLAIVLAAFGDTKLATLRKLAAASAKGHAHCDIPRVDARGLSWADFNQRGLRNAAGVILTGLFNDTELTAWSREAIVSAYGNQAFHADDTRGTYGYPKLGEYIKQQNREMMIFVSDSMLGAFGDAMEFAVKPPRQALFRDFMERPIFSVGVEGSMVPKHDGHPETWHALLQGSKAWFIGRATGSKTQIWENPCGTLRSKRQSAPVGSHFCVQRAGEVLYFGENVDHSACSLEPFVLGVGAQGHTEQWPPLIRASNRGDVAVVRKLTRAARRSSIRKGALSESTGSYGHTALHRAALHGYPAVAQQLLEARADAAARDAEGLAPIFLAAFSGHVPVAELLANGTQGGVKSVDFKGASVLQWAATQGHVELVTALVSRFSVDPRVRDTLGGGSISAAATMGHAELVRYLHSRGADVHEADRDGMQPMHWAAIHGHADMLALLLASRAQLNARSHDGRAPIDMAKAHGHSAAVALLQKARPGRHRKQRRSEL